MTPLFWAALAIVGVQRLAELAYARRTSAGLEARGARAVRPDGYAAIVAVHILFFVGCAAEAILSPWAGLGTWTWVGAGAFVVGAFLRYWSMAVLGDRWSTRVYVVDHPLVARGPYRLLRHPIYLGVSLEIAGFALAFGLWGTLSMASVGNGLALHRRIRTEVAALVEK